MKQVLRPSWKKWLLVELICLVFFAVGIAMVASGEMKGWFTLSVFGIGFFAVPVLFFNSKLEINNKGFLIHNLKKVNFIAWDEVQDFQVVVIGLNKMVGFNFSEKYDRQKKMRAVAVGLSGVEGALPDTYGMKAEDLAVLMVKYQHQFFSEK